MPGELDSLLGSLALMLDRMDELVRVLRRSGDAGELLTARWDPAAPLGGAPAVWNYDHRGTYQGVAIFNYSTGPVRVDFTSGGASAARGGLFTLAARSFIVLPYNGTSVSVSGDAAGAALVVMTEYAPPVNAGSF
jgi:hypothetical protein